MTRLCDCESYALILAAFAAWQVSIYLSLSQTMINRNTSVLKILQQLPA